MCRCVALGAPEFKEHLQQLKDTRGASTIPPPGILRVLNSVACRGAVMFGDSLELERCQEIVKDLSLCTHPFQCAHGRPSMVPLVGMPEVPTCRTLSADCYPFGSLAMTRANPLQVYSNSKPAWAKRPEYENIQAAPDSAPLW